MALDEQRQLILDQFTRQAVPFSQLHERDDAEIHQLLIRTADITPHDDVLDVACGPGLVASEVAQVARHVTGIDLTPAMIKQAQARQQALGLTNLSWVVGDAQPLPFPDSSFSRVITRYSFHHFSDPAGVFNEMIRVCKAGGRVTVADVFTNTVEQASGYDRLEKLRDPSHTHALLLSDYEVLFKQLTDLRCEFYQYPVTVDELLSRSFPEPGNAELFCRTVQEDIGINQLGINASNDGTLRFAFPVVVLSGIKR